MKNKIFIYILALSTFGLVTSCADSLDLSPTTSVAGNEMFEDADKAEVALNGIYRSMYRAGWSTTDNTHQCFGISAYNMMADVMGDDMIMSGQGSGWFWYDCTYAVKSRYASKMWRSYDLWNAYYTWISNANYIIAAKDEMLGTPGEVNYVVGQAYAIRAYSYYYLAQIFARTYKGHENEPCVPIYTEPTTITTQGQPRSTVEAVYTQISNDIQEAITLLADTKQDVKSHIDYRVANGLKARICLTMEKWSDAAAAAKIARTNYKVGGSDDVLKGFNDVSKANVLWGAEIQDDQSGQYAGFFTHLDTTTGSSLYGNTAKKQMNKLLYGRLGADDIRRAWWDPASSNTQMKFKFSNPKKWAGDYIWMRMEEMLLTEAEAECRLGNESKAIELLEELMEERDPNYATTKTGTDLGALTTTWTGSLLEEILIQRRIELWGEIGRIYDIKRLKQGFTRTEAMGWPKGALIEGTNTQNPESYAWVLTIPQSEFDGNSSLDQEVDQNPMGDGI